MVKLGRNRRSTASGAVWMAVIACLFVSLAAGASIHNHSLFGVDGGAEKIAQSKFTCPACVFDGNPTVVAASFDLADSSGSTPVSHGYEPSLHEHDACDALSRAPPSF